MWYLVLGHEIFGSVNVTSYGCENPSLTLMEDHGLKVFESGMLRRIFGPKKDDEIIQVWKELHNEELHNLYSSPNIIRMIKSRRMGWASHVARMGRRGMIQDVGGKPRRKETTRKI
jgi:hypothetical protein